MLGLTRRFGALAAFAAFVLPWVPGTQAQEPLRIGVITFLSGPAAGPFGVPAKNASDLLAEALNKGAVVPGYAKKGFGGRPIELVYVDEVDGKITLVNIKYYPPDQISPPDGMKTIDWDPLRVQAQVMRTNLNHAGHGETP